MSTNKFSDFKLEYEDRLEKVLRKKEFSEEVKKIIRGMFKKVYKEYDKSDMQETTGKNKLKYIADIINAIET